jgi:hypothetical protein
MIKIAFRVIFIFKMAADKIVKMTINNLPILLVAILETVAS